jgi:hypothetical protein
MTLLNLIVLAVCCLALESKKKTNKQTTNERERERERGGGWNAPNLIAKQFPGIDHQHRVSSKYKDRQTGCQQKMRIVCYFPICPHHVSSDKPRWNTKKQRTKEKEKGKEVRVEIEKQSYLEEEKYIRRCRQKRKPKAEENQLYHSELIIDIMLILVGGSPSL